MTKTVLFQEKDQIVVGKPLPFSIYSAENKLLLASGRVVDNGHVREMLFQNGVYRSVDAFDTDRPAAYVEPEIVNSPLALLRKDYSDAHAAHRCVVSMAPTETHEAYNSCLVGIHDQSMILTAPTRPDGSLVVVTPGQTWLCRTFQATTAFRFRSAVLKAGFEPFPHLYLEVPRQVEKRKVRRVARANVFVHGQLQHATNTPCVIVDLSIGGGRIAVGIDVKLERDTPITISAKLDLVGQKFDLHLSGSVVGVFGASDTRHPAVWFYSIRFDELGEQELLVLHGYVADQLAAELNGLWKVLTTNS
jgi:Flagellar protein YcgR